MAQRIRARAIRRAGELLKQVEPARGANQNINVANGNNVLTRKQAAADAGMSHDQANTALRIANVPEDDFEAQVESEKPPTLSAFRHFRRWWIIPEGKLGGKQA
ncbi:hypothetical protein KHP62_02400 [Rhodobacteraceae bacterium NNCM2]|nr:hypothetical protein [Coraliihabitans acroporae]